MSGSGEEAMGVLGAILRQAAEARNDDYIRSICLALLAERAGGVLEFDVEDLKAFESKTEAGKLVLLSEGDGKKVTFTLMPLEDAQKQREQKMQLRDNPAQGSA